MPPRGRPDIAARRRDLLPRLHRGAGGRGHVPGLAGGAVPRARRVARLMWCTSTARSTLARNSGSARAAPGRPGGRGRRDRRRRAGPPRARAGARLHPRRRVPARRGRPPLRHRGIRADRYRHDGPFGEGLYGRAGARPDPRAHHVRQTHHRGIRPTPQRRARALRLPPDQRGPRDATRDHAPPQRGRDPATLRRHDRLSRGGPGTVLREGTRDVTNLCKEPSSDEEENRMAIQRPAEERHTSVRLKNKLLETMLLFLEPWGDVYAMSPEAEVDVIKSGPIEAALELDFRGKEVIVWAPEGCTVTIYRNDVPLGPTSGTRPHL